MDKSQQSILPTWGVIGWNICRRMKFQSWGCASVRQNIRRKSNGLDLKEVLFVKLLLLLLSLHNSYHRLAFHSQKNPRHPVLKKIKIKYFINLFVVSVLSFIILSFSVLVVWWFRVLVISWFGGLVVWWSIDLPVSPDLLNSMNKYFTFLPYPT